MSPSPLENLLLTLFLPNFFPLVVDTQMCVKVEKQGEATSSIGSISWAGLFEARLS